MNTTSVRVAVAGVGAVAVTLLAVLPASADYVPGPSDVVGVGGDTPQFDVAFVADGYGAAAGFNASNPVNKLISFNATADGNARQAYAQGSTETTPVPLNPTVVLRAGTTPVERNSSSGNAITALINDTANPEVINYIFSASQPTSAQQQAASAAGGLHVVQIAKDAVQIAAASTTNAPAGLSAAELVSIYTGNVTTWNQLPGNSSGSSDTIIPELPPTSSSIYKTFIADLTTANGGVAPKLKGDVTVEQNDPTAITSAAQPADAIVPFSSARLNLFNASPAYFHDPVTGKAISSGVKALTGAPGDGGGVYNSPVYHYVIFRQNDLQSTTPMEPGGTLNWAKTLFSDSNANDPLPYFESPEGQTLITDSGATPDYKDCGTTAC